MNGVNPRLISHAEHVVGGSDDDGFNNNNTTFI